MAQFDDRRDAGRALAALLETRVPADAVVVGLARGGVVVAAEVARRLGLPLDALAVRKLGYPRQPEYGIGAVTPGGGGVYVRTKEDLGDDELAGVVADAVAAAEELDAALHERHAPAPVAGRAVVLVDDGLATGATMVAAVRWARSCGAARVVAAAPVASVQAAELLRGEADEVLCLLELQRFGAVGFWFGSFDQVSDREVVALLDASSR